MLLPRDKERAARSGELETIEQRTISAALSRHSGPAESLRFCQKRRSWPIEYQSRKRNLQRARAETRHKCCEGRTRRIAGERLFRHPN